MEARVELVRSGDRTRTSCTHERTCVRAANALTNWASQTDKSRHVDFGQYTWMRDRQGRLGAVFCGFRQSQRLVRSNTVNRLIQDGAHQTENSYSCAGGHICKSEASFFDRFTLPRQVQRGSVEWTRCVYTWLWNYRWFESKRRSCYIWWSCRSQIQSVPLFRRI